MLKNMTKKTIKFYQRFISPMKMPCCRYVPSCSSYAYEAYNRHSFLKASFLSIWRILRCNPFVKGGYDPVP